MIGSGQGFDLCAFARALETGDLGYQLSRYASDAETRIAEEKAVTTARVVRGAQAIWLWLLEMASADPTPDVSNLVNGGDRVAFTQRWHHLDGAVAISVSTAELQDGLISTQHTLLIERRDAEPSSAPSLGPAGERKGPECSR